MIVSSYSEVFSKKRCSWKFRKIHRSLFKLSCKPQVKFLRTPILKKICERLLLIYFEVPISGGCFWCICRMSPSDMFRKIIAKTQWENPVEKRRICLLKKLFSNLFGLVKKYTQFTDVPWKEHSENFCKITFVKVFI